MSSLQDIISKSQGFSAATVPAARTADGGQLYTTLFQPTNSRPFWPGMVRSYKITATGEILDANGDCALDSRRSDGLQDWHFQGRGRSAALLERLEGDAGRE